jgi:FkbM family methyltransferase
MNEYLNKIKQELANNNSSTQKKIKYELIEVKMPQLRFPFYLRLCDTWLIDEVFVKGQFAELGLSSVPNYIIDGGANLGLFTIWVKHCFSNTNVFCVEPDPVNFEILIRNMQFYNNIKLINAGLWNKNTTLQVQEEFAGSGKSVVKEDTAGTINAFSINHIMEQYNIPYIDLLKLDIEGSEKIVFGSNYESWLPKVKTILIELHDQYYPGCGKTFFTAINKVFNDWEYKLKDMGSAVVIINKDFK